MGNLARTFDGIIHCLEETRDHIHEWDDIGPSPGPYFARCDEPVGGIVVPPTTRAQARLLLLEIAGTFLDIAKRIPEPEPGRDETPIGP
jgi:hypothetical protein